MEWAWGTPSYRVFLHLRTVNDSEITWFIYYIFATVTCVTLSSFAVGFSKSPTFVLTSKPGRAFLAGRYRALMWVGMLFPAVCAASSPDIHVWTEYGLVLQLPEVGDYEQYVNTLYWSTYIAVLSACGLIMTEKRRVWFYIVVFLSVFIALWLNGKRNIVILTMALVIISMRIRGITSKRMFYFIISLLVIGFVLYSQWYQERYRPVLSSFDTAYEMARMDFGRDSDVRMALFAELEPAARPILEFRGQSALFDLLFFIPRSLWEEKPRPYYHYITAVALREPLIQRTWGITTTWLSEAIANFGLLGMVLGPAVIVFIGRVGYRPDNPFLTLLTAVICTLLLSIHLAGFTVLWSIWCILMIGSHLSGMRRAASSRAFA
jgi:hypothetical protein